jgi:xanthine/uracil permease
MAHRYNGGQTYDRSIGQLVSDLIRQISTLVQEEIALARTEMSVKLPTFGRSVGMIAGGGALAYAGVLALVAAAIIGLHALLPWWASALLVGLVVLAIGLILVQTGLQTIKRTSLAPRRTIDSLRGYQDMSRGYQDASSGYQDASSGYQEATRPAATTAFTRQR